MEFFGSSYRAVLTGGGFIAGNERASNKGERERERERESVREREIS